MAYRRHLRLTCSGTIGSNEIFSFGLALATGVDGPEDSWLFDPSSATWDDIAQDCVDYFGRPATGIHPRAVLNLVKIAEIGTNGLYLSSPVERVVSRPGGGTATTVIYPNQIARAVTLKTDGDLGRVKGRYYTPCPAILVGDGEGRMLETAADAAEASDQTFLQDLANEPGLDVLGLAPVVASQGRNRNGVQVLPPRNYRVTSVASGRALDTIRSRRSKVVEAPTYVPVA